MEKGKYNILNFKLYYIIQGILWRSFGIYMMETKKKTGRTAERGVYEFKDGEYHLVVQAIILNTKNEILISKRAPFKKFGGMWECNGGSALKGETSLEGILREVKRGVRN